MDKEKYMSMIRRLEQAHSKKELPDRLRFYIDETYNQEDDWIDRYSNHKEKLRRMAKNRNQQ